MIGWERGTTPRKGVVRIPRSLTRTFLLLLCASGLQCKEYDQRQILLQADRDKRLSIFSSAETRRRPLSSSSGGDGFTYAYPHVVSRAVEDKTVTFYILLKSN